MNAKRSGANSQRHSLSRAETFKSFSRDNKKAINCLNVSRSMAGIPFKQRPASVFAKRDQRLSTARDSPNVSDAECNVTNESVEDIL